MINDKKCMTRRAVKSCEECCRYQDCKERKHSLFSYDKGCIELGYDIVIANTQKFKNAWKRGYVNCVQFLRNYFMGQTPAVLTAEQVNGVYVLERLERVCLEEYGTLESCHAKLEKKINEKIKGSRVWSEPRITTTSRTL